jgi:hypothetical protein
MYEAFHYGDGKMEAITEKNGSYISSKSFNMKIYGIQIPLVKNFTG